MISSIGLGGGCHWCTEAVFEHVIGISNVLQGWIKSEPPYDTLSEAVIVEYDEKMIGLETLIQIHLMTHASTSNHSMRDKYRSAIYFFDAKQKNKILDILKKEQEAIDETYVTMVLPYVDFKLNSEEFLHYYQTRPEAPFCQTHIKPKLQKIMKYSRYVR